MTPIKPERIEELRRELSEALESNPVYSEPMEWIFDQEDIADLLQILDDYSAMRAALEAWKKRAEDALSELLTLRAEVKSLKAENEGLLKRLREEFATSVNNAERFQKAEAQLAAAQMTNAKNGAVIIEQMAQLEKQRPLVEAVMGAGVPLKVGGNFWSDDEIAILRAALKLRSEK